MGNIYVPPPNTLLDEGGSEAIVITGGTTATPTTTVTITGDLDVQGALATIQSTVTQIDDKNIELAVTDSPTDTSADGGGITLKGTTDKTITWLDSTDAWHFNQSIALSAEHPKLTFIPTDANGDSQIIFKSLSGSQLANFRCDTTSNALNHFAISAGTSENHLVIDTDGSIGIGTTSPGALLELNAEHPKLLLRSNSANGDGQIVFKSLDGTQLANFRCDTTSNALNHFGISAGTGEDHLVIGSSGNIGIGTTSPDEPLHIVSAGNGGVEIESNSGAPSLIFDMPSNEEARIVFKENTTTLASIVWDSQSPIVNALIFKGKGTNTEVMRIDSAGNLGIGTSSPDTIFHIKSAGANPTVKIESTTVDEVAVLRFDNNRTTDGDIASLVQFYNEGASPIAGIRCFRGSSDTTGDLTLRTSDAERLRIDQDGNVGIGTASPATTLDVVGTLKVSGATTLNGIEYTWPTSDGSNGEQLTTNSSGALTWTAQGSGSGSGITSVAADTTPQLGGDLDVNGKDIVSVSNGNIRIEPHGTGAVMLGQIGGGGTPTYIYGVTIKDAPISLDNATVGGPGAGMGARILWQHSSHTLGTGLTITAINALYLVDANTSGPKVFTIPAASTFGAGVQLVVKNTNQTNDMTLRTSGGSIDGTSGTSGITLAAHGSVTLVSDGSNFHIL